MSAPKRPIGVRPRIESGVLDSLLWATRSPGIKSADGVLRHLAPVSVAMEVLEHPDETVEWVVKEALRWLREERKGSALPVPSDDELEARFGDDRTLVSVFWPLIRFMDACRCGSVPLDDVWNEATLLLDLLHPWSQTPATWLRFVARTIRQQRRREPKSVMDDLVNGVAAKLSGAPARLVAGYAPTGDARNVIPFFVKVVSNIAIDLGLRDLDEIQLLHHDPEIPSSTVRAPLRPSTLRSKAYRDAVKDGRNLEAVRAERAKRAQHQAPDGQVSLSEAARRLGRPLSTVRACVRDLVARGQLPPLMEHGKAQTLRETDLRLVRRRLEQKGRRDHDAAKNALSVAQVAEALQMTRRDVISVVGRICHENNLSLPIVRRVYRLSTVWMDLIKEQQAKRR